MISQVFLFVGLPNKLYELMANPIDRFVGCRFVDPFIENIPGKEKGIVSSWSFVFCS